MFFAKWSDSVSKFTLTGAHWNKILVSWAPWLKVPIIIKKEERRDGD
jgi:hypothetical protein